MKIQKIIYLYLTIGAVIMSLFFAASSVQAAEVVYDPASSQRATGITNLDVGGTLYNVAFTSQTTAGSVYGEVPGDFDFADQNSAGAAVDAVNAVLTSAGVNFVGSEGGTNNVLAEIYDVGYAYELILVGDLDSVLVQEGVSNGGTWTRPTDPDGLSWHFDERTYADFSLVSGCIPATACTGGFVCGTDDDGCGGTINCGTCGSGDSCVENICEAGCTPATECPVNAECGSIPDDGCGNPVDCGGDSCGDTESCVDNICAPTVDPPVVTAFLPGGVYLLLLLDDETCVDEIPATECTAGFECGVEDDGCGGTINCGTCGSGDSCVENICEACTPVKECLTWFECGVTNDGCSGTIDCGTCGTGESCVANICEAECTPATECTVGFNCGEEDDGCGGTLDCGTCSGENTCVENICRDVNLAEIIVGYCEEVARDTGEAIDELDEAYRDLEDCFGEYDDCQSGISDGNPLTCLQDYVECLDRGVDELESACSDFNRELTNATNSAFEEAAQHGLEDEFIQFLYSPAGEVCLAAAKEINLLCAEMFSN
jgi:hypothetical protein